jgi:hypothetical protein
MNIMLCLPLWRVQEVVGYFGRDGGGDGVVTRYFVSDPSGPMLADGHLFGGVHCVGDRANQIPT